MLNERIPARVGSPEQIAFDFRCVWSIGVPVNAAGRRRQLPRTGADRRGCGWWEQRVLFRSQEPLTARTFKLDDLHLILLSAATQRNDANVLPVAATSADQPDRIAKALTALLKHKLIDEAAGLTTGLAWRTDGDERFALVINDAGRAAIGVTDTEGATSTPAIELAEPAGDGAPRAGSKSVAVIALLQRDEGATLSEMVEATGWLPHTTRAALTRLRKKGDAIAKGKRGNVTYYSIVAGA
jgi:hypothetical protein